LDSSGSESLDSPDPQPVATTPDPENTYQCLKWSPFKPDEWCNLYDDASQVYVSMMIIKTPVEQ